MCLIGSVLEGGRKSEKNGLARGVKIDGDATKSCKNTHLLVIMCVRLSKKIGLHNLTNQTQFKKVNVYDQRTNIICNYCKVCIIGRNTGMPLLLCGNRPLESQVKFT